MGEVLFNMHEDKEQFVLDRGRGGILVGGIAAIEAGQSINGVVAHALQEGSLKRGQQGHKFVGHERGKRPEPGCVLRNIVIAKDQRFLSQRLFYQSTINHDTV